MNRVTDRTPNWDCAIGTPEEDHYWDYDGGDHSVGVYGAWVCRFCGKVDSDRDPPSDPDEDAYERNL